MTKTRVLIVEDNVLIAAGLRSQLEELGYEVVPEFCLSGEQAVQMTEKWHPDLILMDMNLKGSIDGTEATKLIKAQSDIPIIFITGYCDDPTLKKIHSYVPICISKPVDKEELRDALEKTISKTPRP